MKIGVISDTHGHFHSQLDILLRGVDLILHAGDIGSLNVLNRLKRIAPVKAVYGNMDNFEVQSNTTIKRVIELNGLRIGLAHGGGSPVDIISRLKKMFGDDNVNIIVFGHTHKPMIDQVGDIFFFNPGDGRRTIGLIELSDEGGFKSKIINL